MTAGLKRETWNEADCSAIYKYWTASIRNDSLLKRTQALVIVMDSHCISSKFSKLYNYDRSHIANYEVHEFMNKYKSSIQLFIYN